MTCKMASFWPRRMIWGSRVGPDLRLRERGHKADTDLRVVWDRRADLDRRVDLDHNRMG